VYAVVYCSKELRRYEQDDDHEMRQQQQQQQPSSTVDRSLYASVEPSTITDDDEHTQAADSHHISPARGRVLYSEVQLTADSSRAASTNAAPDGLYVNA